MIMVGTGIFMRDSWKTAANRGTTKFSSTKIEPKPTNASRHG